MQKNKRKIAFIKVHNELFNYKLPISAFIVYLYLYSLSLVSGFVKVSYDMIAKRCNISPKTAHKAVHKLIEKGLIEKTHRFNDNHYFVSNRYTVKHLQGGFSKLDKRILTLGLDQSSLYILCGINKCQNNEGAFPSYKDLTELTGLSRATVINKVKILQAQGLIAKETRQSVVIENKFVHNAYQVISIDLRAFVFALILKLNKIPKNIKKEILKDYNPFTKRLYAIVCSIRKKTTYLLGYFMSFLYNVYFIIFKDKKIRLNI